MSRTAWERRAPDHELTLGDVGVVVEDTLRSNTGAVVDLTGATIRYQARLPGSASLDIDQLAGAIAPATNGQVRYTFVSADTDTLGAYIEQWKVTYSGGGVEYFPTAAHKLLIRDWMSLGAAGDLIYGGY